jgi:hypothetical protein
MERRQDEEDPMTRRAAVLPLAFLIASLALASMTAVASASAHTTLTTSLSGAEEAPGPGDPNGKGFVSLDIYPNGTVCYTGKVQAIGREITGAHIHVGAAGVPGPVVVDLDPFGAEITGNMASHCVVTSAATAAAIIADPSAYYVNVHTTAYPGGAIRGQLGD